MANCEYCNQDMTNDQSSCTWNAVKISGKFYKRNTDYHDVNERCHDCGILNGGVHHFGCDMERCPVCKDQLAFCGCDLTGFSKISEEAQ